MRDYYCSEKFDTLEVRLFDGWVASCCKAKSDRLTMDLLEKDPQGFFNWPKLIEEREMMLQNQRVPGCEKPCWEPEDRNLISRRTEDTNFYAGDLERLNIEHGRRSAIKQVKYSGTRHIPKTINLITSNTCNLSCSYCFKGFSSTWLKDVADNGDYNIPGHEDRYNLSNVDRLMLRSGQKIQKQTAIGNMIMQQIENNMDQLETLVITGGEPLLYSGLEDILEKFSSKNIWLFSGLGVPENRVRRLLPLLNRPNVKIFVSAENTEKFYEFNRYGISYKDFTKNLNLVREVCHVAFNSVISNVTIFDYANFSETYRDMDRKISFAYTPSFFGPQILDPYSKETLAREFEQRVPEFAPVLNPAMQAMPNDIERNNLAKFLKRFASSRNLDINIFPQSFVDWINQAPSYKFIPIKAQQ